MEIEEKKRLNAIEWYSNYLLKFYMDDYDGDIKSRTCVAVLEEILREVEKLKALNAKKSDSLSGERKQWSLYAEDIEDS